MKFFALFWIVFLGCSQEEVRGVRSDGSVDLQFEIKYIFYSVNLKRMEVQAVIPSSIAGRQSILQREWSLKPAHITESSGDSIGRFLFFKPGPRVELWVKGVVRVYPADSVWQEDSLQSLLQSPYQISTLDSQSMVVWDSLVSSVQSKMGTQSPRWKVIHSTINETVHQFVTHKGTQRDLSFNQLLKERQGDCTENALLASSLCQSLGLKSRRVSGIHSRPDMLPFHSWVECQNAEGLWWHLDPTWQDVPLLKQGGRPPWTMVLSRTDRSLGPHRFVSYRAEADSIRLEVEATLKAIAQ